MNSVGPVCLSVEAIDPRARNRSNRGANTASNCHAYHGEHGVYGEGNTKGLVRFLSGLSGLSDEIRPAPLSHTTRLKKRTNTITRKKTSAKYLAPDVLLVVSPCRYAYTFRDYLSRERRNSCHQNKESRSTFSSNGSI